MSRPPAFLQRQTELFFGALDEIREISQTAATTDDAGRWGIDGWIRVIHDLIDLQIRSVAALTEATISGPWWNQRAHEPSELDVLHAEKTRAYPRTIEFVEPFRRVGTDQLLPHDKLVITPVSLASGEVKFRVALKDAKQDADLMGANYVGTIRFCQICDGPGAKPDEQIITIGL